MEEELRASEMRVSGIVNTAVDGIMTIDSKGTIETTNPAVEHIFGWGADEMIGRNIKMLMPEPDHSGHDGYLHNYITTGRAKIIGIGRDVSGRRKDGTVFPIELSVAELPQLDRRAFVGILRDISDRKIAEEKIHAVTTQMKSMVAALQRRDRGLTLLSRMNDLLMACNSRDEAYRVIELCAEDIFTKRSGALAVLSDNESDLLTVLHWGTQLGASKSFSVDDCWALRKGNYHEVDNPRRGPACNHVTDPPENGYLCQPLLVHGNLFGLLTVEIWHADEPGLENYRNLIMTMGETMKLTLSNLVLREVLHEQAIRDPLTRLLNRRAMEEGLEREMARARRSRSPLVVGMLDIDLFKRVNDTFGHDAGDLVLRALGTVLSTTLRISDIICRYGGEEILIVMPDSDINSAARRVEEIRRKFNELDVLHDGRSIGPVTLSAGLAIMHDADTTTTKLIRVADGALLAAKKGGRDRLVIANVRDASDTQSKRAWRTPSARAVT
jgi:diguanylate cyclase (GGDEF)-like protein/PAS domain S-box-containing protein